MLKSDLRSSEIFDVMFDTLVEEDTFKKVWEMHPCFCDQVYPEEGIPFDHMRERLREFTKLPEHIEFAMSNLPTAKDRSSFMCYHFNGHWNKIENGGGLVPNKFLALTNFSCSLF